MMKRTYTNPSFHLTEEERSNLKQIDLGRFLEEVCHVECKSRSGGNRYYMSPFRAETEPSFTVQYYKGEWRWRDWGGDEKDDHGDIFALVMRLWNVEFLEAARMLMAQEFPSEYYEMEDRAEALTKERKIAFAKHLYGRMLKVNNLGIINQYFSDKGVEYHHQMGCVVRNDFREKKLYIVVPIPTPWNMRGLELREFKGSARKTLGEKALWYLSRDPKTVLVTESILDCLAGEIVLGNSTMSLCSINGVGNVLQLKEYLRHFKPDDVYLAFDNDEPGRVARDKTIEIISVMEADITLVEDHFDAGVKDLHKLLTLGKEIPTKYAFKGF